MLRKLLVCISFVLIILSCASFVKIDNPYTYKFNIINNQPITSHEQPIGKLIINKINLKENLYDINSSENNVDKHPTILKESIFPENDNSIMFIAAHSGTGKIAYFNELDKLKQNDPIILIINNKKYNYIVKDIWEDKKDGYININKEVEQQLVLTTCSPNHNNYQLIVNCIKKES